MHDEINQLIAKITQDNTDLAVILFGSRAKGNFRKFSDYDLGILAEGKLPLDRWLKLRDLSEESTEDFPLMVDLVDLSRAPDKFLSEVKSSAKFISGNLRVWEQFSCKT